MAAPASPPAVETVPVRRPSAAAYTLRGELERLVDPTGAITAYSYDALGRLVEAVDANGGTTGFVNPIWPHCDGLIWPHLGACLIVSMAAADAEWSLIE